MSGMWLAGLAAGASGLVQAAAVVESERALPVCQSVDVVVVGGTCGAVAAAEAAARAGAKVFLAAPRPYLGDDVAGTLRLWLEEGEVPVSPLARSIYVQTEEALSFTYTTDVPSGGKHMDTGDMLADGRFEDVQHQTVEYAGDVAILADLGGQKTVAGVDLTAFKRAGDFEADSAHLSVSADGKTWSKAIPLVPEERDEPGMVRYCAPLGLPARQVKVAVKMKAGAKRLLLSELTLRASGGGASVVVPTPLRVKQALDKALLDSGVAFLTSSYATEVLRDAAGQPAGIVIANRSGRQAVTAKVIVDATERGTVARLAGAAFQPYPAGPQTFTRVLIAGEPPSSQEMTVKALSGDYDAPITGGSRKNPVKSVAGKAYECALRIDMRDGSFRSFAAAEQVARDRTFVKTLLEGADSLFQVPPDPMAGTTPLKGVWPGAEGVDLGCFRPAGVPRLFVLGGCADLPREAAEKLLRPLALMAAGERVGAAAAAEAKALPAPAGVARKGDSASATVNAGEVRELLAGPRPYVSGLPVVRSERAALPVWGEYDVVVVGGGTGGAPAGIAAGRQGAKTLVLEHLYGLGGVGTLGMIGKYWYGNVCGFTEEHDKGVEALSAAVHVVGKSEWWRRENRKAGVELWFGAMGCGTLVDGSRVTGVVVATAFGRGVVLAKCVVDATGNAEVAASAGAACVFQGAEELALQGVGLSPRKLGASYINSDFGYVNDCDAADLWLFGVRGRAGAGKVWDVSQLVESRERQRIVGDCWVTPLDLLNGRTFPDTVVQARSNFDSHGYSVADICYVSEPTGKKIYAVNVPYRALLPKGVEGLAVIGLGVSAHRDAMPIMRMQPDIQNMGYVAGVAGATAAREGKTFRSIDVKALQRHLVEKGNLPPEVLEWKDNALVDRERLALAVKRLGENYKDVSLVLAQAEQALPQLRQAYQEATAPSAKLVYAHVLGILGDPAGAETLAEVVSGRAAALNLNLKNEAAFGRRMGEEDSYIVALGRTRDKRALAPLLEVVSKMDSRSTFARFRAVTLALEALGDPAAARPLAELMLKPGLIGYAMTDTKSATPAGGFNGGGGDERNLCLRELALARALYRCGDFNGIGLKVLKTYERDLRGVYALHATEVLKATPSPPSLQGSGGRKKRAAHLPPR